MRSARPGSAFSLDGIPSFVLDPHIGPVLLCPTTRTTSDLTREIGGFLTDRVASSIVSGGSDDGHGPADRRTPRGRADRARRVGRVRSRATVDGAEASGRL